MAEELTQLYDPSNGVMRVAGFMSLGGSTLLKMIDYTENVFRETGKYPFKFAMIFTDNNDKSKAAKIGKEKGILVCYNDLMSFCQRQGVDWRDLIARREYDDITDKHLEAEGVNVIAMAGYMLKATYTLTDKNGRVCLNSHPCDLTKTDDIGRRKYTGAKAVAKAILDRAPELRATINIAKYSHVEADNRVDGGPVLMISDPLPITLSPGFDYNYSQQVKIAADDHQDRLKLIGDHLIYPKTLEYIAQGRFAGDKYGNIYFDEKRIPYGIDPRGEVRAA